MQHRADADPDLVDHLGSSAADGQRAPGDRAAHRASAVGGSVADGSTADRAAADEDGGGRSTRSVAPSAGAIGQRPMVGLPDEVRSRLVTWAAEALGGIPVAQVPTALVRIARFAPAKRARLAGPALVHALDDDGAFRALVAERAPDAAAVAGDLAAVAARAVLLGAADAGDRLAAVHEQRTVAGARHRVAELEEQVARLTDRVQVLTAEAGQVRSGRTESGTAATAEADKLRTRLREQGTRMRRLHDENAELRAQTERLDAEQAAALSAARAETDRWRQRAEAATERLEAANRTVAELRQVAAAGRRVVDDRRIELLLEAVEGAAAGLRREWQLTGGGSDPADRVAAAWAPSAREPGERTADPGRLGAWLALPGAHLLVDGYNVTKTGYPEMPLAEQRDRLVRSLAALAARTSVEVTVVFDGAAVSTARPSGRRVRVLFSPPGVIADDVLRQLVAAEPAGRVVIVVSSDREVYESVGRAGARTAPSSALLALR